MLLKLLTNEKILTSLRTSHSKIIHVITLEIAKSCSFLFSWTFREISVLFWLHVESLALAWDRVGGLGLHGKHTRLLWDVTSLLYRRWHSCLLACRRCFKVAAGGLHLHKFGKLVISGSHRCVGHLIFFVSGCLTKTASSPLVENCICLGRGDLWLSKCYEKNLNVETVFFSLAACVCVWRGGGRGREEGGGISHLKQSTHVSLKI